MLDVFVSGLQRQSGKTIVAAGIAATMQSLSYSTSVYKPIQIGSIKLNDFKSSPDMAYVKLFDSNILTHSTYLLSGLSSPFVSSYEDGVNIDLNNIFSDFQSLKINDCNIVEGVNSLFAPVAKDLIELDIVKTLNIPLLLVVNPKVSTISDVLMCLKSINAEGVKFAGIIINQYDENSDNLEHKYFPQILKEFCDVETLIEDILTKVDIEEVFGLKIAKLNS